MYGLKTNTNIGDIILIRGNGKVSSIISKSTSGPFSHCCLIVKDNFILEAVKSGVQYTSNIDFLVGSKKNIKILRPNFTNRETASRTRSHIENISKKHNLLDYNLLDLLNIFLRKNEKMQTDKYFCSELVARIFRHSGFPLFEEKDFHVSPNDFLKCNLLTDITDDVVGVVPDYIVKQFIKSGRKYNLLDRGNSTSSETHQKFKTLVHQAKPIFERYNLSPPVYFHDLILTLVAAENSNIYKDLDNKLTSLFDSLKINSSFEDLLNQDSDINDELEELECELQKFGINILTNEISWCHYMLAVIEKEFQSYKHHENDFSNWYNSLDLQFLKRMRDHYRLLVTIRSIAKKRINARLNVLEIWEFKNMNAPKQDGLG